MSVPWHHAPVHQLLDSGAFIVTAGTYQKQHFLRSHKRLDAFVSSLRGYAEKYGWILQAWAVFSNHYHFVGISPRSAENLPEFLSQLHSNCADMLNVEDGLAGRRVWFNYWETRLTFERSYLARLSYVNNNPIKHGLVRRAVDYRWCSANWFRNNAPGSFVKTVMSFNTDRVNVSDPFEPLATTD